MANNSNIQSIFFEPGLKWFRENEWTAFPFQLETWEAHLSGLSGLVNAPTGSGKTFSLLIPILLEFLRDHAAHPTKKNNGVQAIWITPIRALGKEIELSAKRAIEALGLRWKVGVRTGDTSTKERARQRENPPDFLITTPESLHLLLTQKGYATYFGELKTIVADEWHELMGSKRGVQVELALSRLKSIVPRLKVWGISATIGNMDQAVEVLLGQDSKKNNFKVIRSAAKKEIEIISIFPDQLEVLPWSGHIGIKMIDKVIPIVEASTTTLIFTNTRSFAEVWYHKILEKAPELSGLMAMHHGSISQSIRNWVEEQLHAGKLKLVVCTSSLDLGVDFRPVETIIQVGSPKGIARFLQRAGRSGHQPGAVSRIYFLPTHSLELTEAAALREGFKKNVVEDRIPYVRSFDVLIQYLITLAVSDGFRPDEILGEVRGTYSYSSLTDDEWNWLLTFLVTGGDALTAYDEYRKVVVDEGVYRVVDPRIALRHRLSIGTIVGDALLFVKYVSGKYLGTIEEYFLASLNPGDAFWFAGKSLELIRIKEMEAHVRKTTRKWDACPRGRGDECPCRRK